MNKITLLAMSLSIIILQACSSSDGGSALDSPTIPNNSSPGALTGEDSLTIPSSLTAASSAYQFDYTMTSVTDDLTTARAQVFEPVSTAPADGHPLVVWAHGTTGIANACQPSAAFNTFTNASAINALLSEGYAVLAPDYEGFGTERIHPYYVRSSHANALTQSIPAAHQLEGVNISDDWAIVGHSQGGHVALAAARATVLPAYPLQAVVALAPGTDLQPFSDGVFDAIDRNVAEGNFDEASDRLFYLNVYAAFVAHAISEVEPAFNPESIFGEDIKGLIDTAVTETQCNAYASSVREVVSAHFLAGGTPAEFEGLNRQWYEDSLINARLEAEALSDEAQAAPLLIVQGDADRQVPIAAITAFVDQQRSIGTDVTYEIVADGRHSDVANSEFFRVINWLSDRFPAR